MRDRSCRNGATLVEVLVVVAVVGVLAGLTAAAVQRVRAAAARAACSHRVAQLVLAAHNFAAARGHLPAGCDFPGAKSRTDTYSLAGLSWHTALLGDLGEAQVYARAQAAFQTDPTGIRDFRAHARAGRAAPAVLRCPAEEQVRSPLLHFGLTSYQGVAGTGEWRNDGLLHSLLTVRFTDITDGTSSTLLLGERPPGPDGRFSEWYGNWGSARCGVAQILPAGVQARPTDGVGCDLAAKSLAPGRPGDECSLGHFWSLHPGGANFAFADGSVRFLPYTSASILPALATRTGGETVAPD